MISIGNDIIEIERIRTSLKNHGEALLDRLLTPKEKAYCLAFSDPAPRFAGRFAAKEAVAKALGSGFGKKVMWQDIEILNNEEGEPIVSFSSQLKEHFGKDLRVLVSISHCDTYATAVALRLQ